MNTIKKLQNIDPLSEAEKLTGKSYKEDKATESLGFLMHLQHVQQMNGIMESTDDTKFSEKTEEYIRKITDFGFEQIYKEDFVNNDWDKPTNESLYIFWHPIYSVLLKFDTFQGCRNGGNFYYNWIPNDRENLFNYTSSGGFETLDMKPDLSGELKFPEQKPECDLSSTKSWNRYKELNSQYHERLDAFREENGLIAIWSGYHDCREALKNNINQLAENGTFMKKWYKAPFISLLHHKDNHDDFDKIRQSRIEKFPTHVRECIGFVKRKENCPSCRSIKKKSHLCPDKWHI